MRARSTRCAPPIRRGTRATGGSTRWCRADSGGVLLRGCSEEGSVARSVGIIIESLIVYSEIRRPIRAPPHVDRPCGQIGADSRRRLGVNPPVEIAADRSRVNRWASRGGRASGTARVSSTRSLLGALIRWGDRVWTAITATAFQSASDGEPRRSSTAAAGRLRFWMPPVSTSVPALELTASRITLL
jgi:hypothetical protein